MERDGGMAIETRKMMATRTMGAIGNIH